MVGEDASEWERRLGSSRGGEKNSTSLLYILGLNIYLGEIDYPAWSDLYSHNYFINSYKQNVVQELAYSFHTWKLEYVLPKENRKPLYYMSHLFYDDKQRKHSSNLLSEVNIHTYI